MTSSLATQAVADTSVVRRLLLTTVTHDFDPARDIPAGASCFVGAEGVHREWEKLDFVDPFADPDAVRRADRNLARLTYALIRALTPKFNELHGTHYGERFWYVLLVPWIHSLVHIAWSRWSQIAALAARHREDVVDVEIAADAPALTIGDLIDFWFEIQYSDSLALWIDGQAILHCAPRRWRIRPLALPNFRLAAEIDRTQPEERASRVGRFLRHMMPRMRFDNVPGARAWFLPFSLMLATMPSKGRPARFHPPAGEVEGGYFPDSFRRMVDDLIKLTCPTAFGRDFTKWDGLARRLPYGRGKVVVDLSSNYNTKARFMLAHAHEIGEISVFPQHGGHCGWADSLMGVPIDYIHDTYVTFGWTEHAPYDGTFLPLPVPMLSPVRNAHRRKTDELIYVVTRHRVRPFRIEAIPRPRQSLDERRGRLSFIEGLDEGPRRGLRYRPYRRAAEELVDAEYVTKAVPDVTILEGDLDSRLLGCRLAVLSHPGTTLQFTLAANVPTICFWERDSYRFSASAEPEFAMLEAAGLIHYSPLAAAQRVNGLWGDVETWWRSPVVQEARRAWCRKHARTSRFWWWHWARALWNL